MKQAKLSLRDYLAAAALQSLLVSSPKGARTAGHYKNAAEDAYRYADAMIAARDSNKAKNNEVAPAPAVVEDRGPDSK